MKSTRSLYATVTVELSDVYTPSPFLDLTLGPSPDGSISQYSLSADSYLILSPVVCIHHLRAQTRASDRRHV